MKNDMVYEELMNDNESSECQWYGDSKDDIENMN